MKAVGATVNIKWKDTHEKKFEEYLSFGEYDEDEESDGLGTPDAFVFFYADGVSDLDNYTQLKSKEDWFIEEVVEVIYNTTKENRK